MIDFKKHPMIADQVEVAYEGPGYYSTRTSKPLSDPITLVKIAEEYIEQKEINYFAKVEGYRVIPYLINCCNDIPEHWEVIGCNNIEELEENY